MRKRRQFRAGRCYHLVSRIAHRAFFLDEEEKNRFVEVLMAKGLSYVTAASSADRELSIENV